MDTALIILRGIVGLYLFGHGANKLLGWIVGASVGPWRGFRGLTAWLESMRLRPAPFWAGLAVISEFGGGVLFTLGLFSPLGSLGIGAAMLMAIAKVHWPRIWVTEGGFELPLTNLAVVTAVAVMGPGAFSLDHVLKTSLRPEALLVGPAVVVVLWFVGILTSLPNPDEHAARVRAPDGESAARSLDATSRDAA